MKAKLIGLSVLSFCLLLYFAKEEIYFPYILVPFIGFAITVFIWPSPDDRKRKSKSKGYEYSDPDSWDVAGKSIKALKNKRDNEHIDSDIDI